MGSLISEIDKLIRGVNEAFTPLILAIKRIHDQFNSFIKEHPDFLKNLQSIIEAWPTALKDHWVEISKHGWFMNWFTPITVGDALSKGKETLDKFMIHHLEADWDDITGNIKHFCPERKHVLDVAFKLHEEGNYIACIPLFLSQTDGICAQYLGAYLFSEHERRKDTVQSTIDDSGDTFLRILLEVLNEETQFGAGVSAASQAKKETAPNRNGILHGSRKHLDYGTKINSMKCFALLAFVTFCLAEKLAEKKTLKP